MQNDPREHAPDADLTKLQAFPECTAASRKQRTLLELLVIVFLVVLFTAKVAVIVRGLLLLLLLIVLQAAEKTRSTDPFRGFHRVFIGLVSRNDMLIRAAARTVTLRPPQCGSTSAGHSAGRRDAGTWLP